ncbi:3-phosphoshikimate 1-carboxyvinyltransferase [Lapidilactobacillus gannanensis]|uniref:3-phosphoshikimate 1-carboxyvinyltransferase n=1 Tax=Lapidilactobacillus gannanensis TaxID=2486002 RepID=A0ABW4BQ02_9LACO|nr:3-phosphoshikimate 1-carboxyvinyltransferase [Lapidilactobacillus gannanensis]
MNEQQIIDTYQTKFQPQLTRGLRGNYQAPSDKSISQRALIFAALAQGTSELTSILPAEDVRHTANALMQLGIQIVQREQLTWVVGQGGWQFKPLTSHPQLDLGNSGTGTRLLLPLLARQPFTSQLIGDASLSQRPLTHFLTALQKMGAKFVGGPGLPLTILPNGQLQGLDYQLPVASAQLKSALILAALQAQGPSHLVTLAPTRDHTERLLHLFGASVAVHQQQINVLPLQQPLQATGLTIPGDPSSAAFLIVAALLLPQSQLRVTNHSLNPTRTGLLQLLQQIGAPIQIQPALVKTAEPVGTIAVGSLGAQAYAPLLIDQRNLGQVIDEIPILSLLATQLTGTSIIRQATSLRHKETDRLHVVAEQLQLLGAQISEQADGLTIVGPTPLHLPDQPLNAHQDHRIAMTLIVACLILGQKVPIIGLASIATSYPHFLDDLIALNQGARA